MLYCQEVKINHKGFSLIEILFILAILGILSGIAIPGYLNAKYKAQVGLAIADINTISKEIYVYQASHGSLPDQLVELGLSDIRDPWGVPYQFLNFENIKGKGKMRKDRFMVPINTYFDLYSMGKDGKSVTPITAAPSRDDIIFANDGGFIGLVSDY